MKYSTQPASIDELAQELRPAPLRALYAIGRAGKRVGGAARRVFDNKYTRTAVGVSAGVAGLAIGADLAYAQATGEAAATYGFGSGLLDGLLMEINIVMDIFNDGQTWARDGTGAISRPNTGAGYWTGYVLTAGVENSLFIGLGSKVFGDGTSDCGSCEADGCGDGMDFDFD